MFKPILPKEEPLPIPIGDYIILSLERARFPNAPAKAFVRFNGLINGSEEEKMVLEIGRYHRENESHSANPTYFPTHVKHIKYRINESFDLTLEVAAISPLQLKVFDRSEKPLGL